MSSLAPDKSAEAAAMFEVLKNPFRHLQTEYKRFQYFESCGKYILPIPYEIDSREERIKSKGGVTLQMRKVLGQLIPLRKLFQKLFELPDFF